MREPSFEELEWRDYRLDIPCRHKSVKSLTTNDGVVYACEECSRHIFVRYHDIEAIRATAGKSGD